MLSLQLAKIEVLNERKHSAFFSTPNQIQRKLLLFGRCDKTHDPKSTDNRDYASSTAKQLVTTGSIVRDNGIKESKYLITFTDDRIN